MHQMAGLNAVRPTTGKVFLVGNATLVDMYRLKELFKVDPDGDVRIFSGLEEAMSSGDIVANRGDVVLLAPGHVETITTAAGIDMDIAGVSVVGLGTGSLRPTFNFSTTVNADMDIDAANISFENCIFNLTGIDALVAPIDVNAANFTMRGCLVTTASASAQATVPLLTDANASGLTIIGCSFLGSANAGNNTAIRIVGGDNHVIRGNVFIGDYSTVNGAIENLTTACLNVIVEDNYIYNRTASSTKAMVFVAGSTGIIANNRMQILSGTAPITGAAMSWVGANYYAATIATAGTLI